MASWRRRILALTYRLGRGVSRSRLRLQRSGAGLWRRLARSLNRLLHPGHRRPQEGFILPTTALLLVVIALTVVSLSLRTLNRATQISGDRGQKVIYNAASPAIDRARAKLEKLFTSDPRLATNGVPAEDYLEALMLNDRRNGTPQLDGDPYKLPDEDPLELNGQKANAWTYKEDTDGDGTPDVKVAYSILMRTPAVATGGDVEFRQDNASLASRARAFITRTGPIGADAQNNLCPDLTVRNPEALPPLERGWFQDRQRTSTLRKNFQINAVVAPLNGEERGISTIATLEMQQERLAEKGNKWGAWFRHDLEVFPGDDFAWNGAMHTEGSMFLSGNGTRGAPRLKLFMVSAPQSCVYSPEASELTAARITPDANNPDQPEFVGQFAATTVTGVRTNFNAALNRNRTAIDYPADSSDPNSAPAEVTLQGGRDSANFIPPTDSVRDSISRPIDLTLNPVRVVTEDISEFRNGARPSTFRGGAEDAAWQERPFVRNGRVQNTSKPKPYLDDFYRADNRWGPKPAYADDPKDTGRIGTPVTQANKVRNVNRAAPQEVGLDGYWERRTLREGLRILVGQRLNLGVDPVNPAGYPLEAAEFDARRPHEGLQRRDMRDPLAAVQGTLLYHRTKGNGAKPVAALAMAAHPGSPETLKRAATAETVDDPYAVNADFGALFGDQFGDDADELAIDFFHGRGTNGWEFDVNRALSNVEVTASDTSSTVSVRPAMGKALENLATFAGDPKGAFPAEQEAGVAHPLPEMRKWGNFAELRRALSGSGNASLADQSTKETAGLSLGMLAYNLSYAEAFDYANPDNQDRLRDLAGQLAQVGDKTSASATAVGSEPAGGSLKEDALLAKSRMRGNPTLPEEADTTVLGNADLRTRRLAEYAAGKVDVFRATGAANSPFSVRVYPAGAVTTQAQIGQAGRYIERQLSLAADDEKPSPLLDMGLIDDPNDPTKMRDVPMVPPEAYVMALGRAPATGTLPATAIEETESQRLARLIALKEQINRDRTFGFAPVKATNTAANDINTNYTYQISYAAPFSGSAATCTGTERYTGLGEDRNCNGVIDTLNEATVGIDLNGDGDRTDTISEDLNGNGILDVETPTLKAAPAATYRHNNPVATPGQRILHESDSNGNGLVDPTEERTATGNVAAKFDRTLYFAFGGRTYYQGDTYKFGCDLSEETGNNFFGFGAPTNYEEEQQFVHLAATLCPVEPKYPSLYYLFPRYGHGLAGGATQETFTVGGETYTIELDHNQPILPANPYYDRYLGDTAIRTAVGGYQFQPVTNEELATVAVKPLAIADWVTPHEAITPTGDCAASAPNCMEENLVALRNHQTNTTQVYRVAFKDSVLFSGRDLLTNRVLDVDVDMLRSNSISGDTWLTRGDIEDERQGGLIYAFREDALREDAIARPANGAWSGYDPDNATQRMLVNRYPGVDPPLNPETGISPKAVDYYSDPDRRIHGFRLKNGENVARPGGGGDNIFGLTFISDNPLYIFGDLNFHRGSGGGGTIEEFRQPLNTDNYGNFYSRGRSDQNEAFANPAQDNWRPVELLADIVSPLSKNFCDGSAQDAFTSIPLTGRQITERYGCNSRQGNVGYTSFHNQNVPSTPKVRENWWHEDRFDVTSPIAIALTGQALELTNDTVGGPRPYAYNSYVPMPADLRGDKGAPGGVMKAQDTTVNAVFVSGIGSSRAEQSYGGLHNFPPFLEDWRNVVIQISGAFLQLNYRNYSTGNYDADAWEANRNPLPEEILTYYQAPTRQWGYDVGLQYAPAGPLASRFVTLGNTRSEFYSEPAANDPYICLLRQAMNDPTADGDCP
jgi:hypothetical protein